MTSELQKIAGSSTIDAVGYDPDSRELTVRFHSGGTYLFFDVPEDKHQNLITADSVGRYFHRHIRGCHLAEKRS